VAVLTVLLIFTYSRSQSPAPAGTPHVKHAVADMFDSSKQLVGRVSFQQEWPNSPVTISIDLVGVPEGTHAFHIHEFGDVSSCAAAGAHFNPAGVSHGAPADRLRHVGDLGNVKANADKRVQTEFADFVISLSGVNSIIGRAVVLHEKEDDFGLGGHSDSLTTGHAGSRIACGTIGVATPPK